MKFLYFAALILALCAISGCAKKNNAKQILGNAPQDVFAYIKPDTLQNILITKTEQKKRAEDYLQRYFSPWSNNENILYGYIKSTEIKNKETEYLAQFEKNPGFGENQQAYTSTWINQIKHNIDLDTFDKQTQKAIVVNAANLRVLPTLEPSYSSVKKAGQFYPFDNLQESFVSVGTPALILQNTKDGAWDLILIHNDFGWIQHQDIAYVDEKFIHQWQTPPFGVITADHTPIYINQKFAFSGRMGSIYPMPTLTSGNAVYIPIRNSEQQAVMLSAEVDKDNDKDKNKNNTQLSLFPMILSEKNIADLAQSLLGNPYGWGGMYGYRDCSATTGDLFAPFGIWLPRNSGEQAKIGKIISLKNFSRKEKTNIIIQQGIPFLTLIHLPGHIMLYIGVHDHKIIVFQDIWGLHTGVPFLPFMGEGRAVIGQTIISPLDFDRRFINVPTPLIDKITGIAIL